MNKIIIAHRGMSSLAPENTLSAFKLCKEYGVKWFECDVDILGDGTLIISHDDTLDRCTDKSGSLHNLKKEDLHNIDAGSWFSDNYIGERIPMLTQLIELINKYKLNVNFELKSWGGNKDLEELLINKFAQKLKEIDKEREVIVSSFNPILLSKFKDISPQTPVCCLFEKNKLDDYKSIMEYCKAEYIHPQSKGLTQKMVKEFKKHGYKINVWTVNDLAKANQLFNWGVDGIITDIGDKFPSKYKFKESLAKYILKKMSGK